MNKHVIRFIVLSVVYLCFGQTSSFGNNYLYLHTDRFCFASGDVAFVKVCSWGDQVLPNQTLYLDLCGLDNTIVNGAVLDFSDCETSGYIEIPDTLSTGYYDLKVRLESSKYADDPVLAHKRLFVTNRFVLQSTTSIKTLSLSDSLENEKELKHFNSQCDLTLNANRFSTRNKVSFDLVSKLERENEVVKGVLTAKPIYEHERAIGLLNKSIIEIAPIEDNELSIFKNKEPLAGMRLKGVLKDEQLKKVLKNCALFLCFEDTLMRFKYAITDSLGNFCFNVEGYKGEQKAFFSAYSYPELKAVDNFEIQFEKQDFVSISDVNSLISFDQDVLLVDSNSVIKAIVNKAYGQSCIHRFDGFQRDTTFYEQYYFMGSRDQTVQLDNYVSLSDFKSIATEILPDIKFKQDEGGVKIGIYNSMKNGFVYDPMVFVDGVPLFDYSKIAELGSDKIKQIDVRSKPRCYGDLFFNRGLIQIWTRHLDFWNNVSSKKSQQIILNFYQMPAVFAFPDYSRKNSEAEPDFRQTLYWNPNVVLNGGSSKEFEFYTSDEKGKFEILFEGVSSSGRAVSIKKIFTVE